MKRESRICTIGGGSGMPIINSALIQAGFNNISSVVSTFDSGGDTGRMRTDERGKILAFSDYWRALISLWEDGEQKAIWEEMLRYRDGRERNFGNIFFQFLSEKEGSLGKVDKLFEKLTGADLRGEVIPVPFNPSNVCFKTISGKKYHGENYVDDLRMSRDVIDEIWLEPSVEANDKAIEVLKNADLIIVGPGTTYGSVLPNFLPNGIVEAYNSSKAKKLLFVNIFSPANEVKDSTQAGYVEIFSKYLKNNSPFDLIVMADVNKLDQNLFEKALLNYQLENSSFVKFDDKSGDKTVLVDIAQIEEKNIRLRHSKDKLAKFFADLDI